MTDNHTFHMAEPLSARALRTDSDVGLRQFLLRVYNYMASGPAYRWQACRD